MAEAKFKFISDASGGDLFTVISFSGHEAISALYEYQIEIKAPLSATISLDGVLDSPARFITELDGREFPVYGMLSNFEELRTVQNYVHYRAVLVPRLWALSIYKTNEIYTSEKTVDVIIQTVLDNANLDGADIDYDLGGLVNKTDFLNRDYVCQFGESDFDFISRLMENEGIFYYFEHGSGPLEKVIFVNDTNYETIPRPGLIFDVAAMANRQYDCIDAWSCRKQRLAGGVTVRDYNPEHPSVDISDTATVDPKSQGCDYIYGENIRDTDEASYLSEIRAEERLCKKTRYYGEGSVTRLRAGYLFEMEAHPNQAFNGLEYLAIEVDHEGHHLDTSLAFGDTAQPQAVPFYRNSFVAIDASEQFRPARVMAKPRFYGTMTAFIYAESGMDKAEIDEYGCYRVHLPFDRADGTRESTNPDRKASTWIRMAQNYVGKDKGSYFPLTGGTEVLLSFINGDPDQPIIIGAVPNASEPSLLTAENETESVVQTGSGNKIRMGDVEGEDRIVMESPTAESWVRIGTPNDPIPNVIDDDATDGIRMSTAGNYVTNAGGFSAASVGGLSVNYVDQSYTLVARYDGACAEGSNNCIQLKLGVPEGDADSTLDKVVLDTGGRDLEIKCAHFDLDNSSEDNVTHGHDYAKHFGTAVEEFYGASTSHYFGEAFETYIGAKQEICVAACGEIFVGGKAEVSLAASAEAYFGAAAGAFFGASAEAHFGASAEAYFGAKAEAFFGASAEYFSGLKLETSLGVVVENVNVLKINANPGGEVEIDAPGAKVTAAQKVQIESKGVKITQCGLTLIT